MQDACAAANLGGIFLGVQMPNRGDCAYQTCVIETNFVERMGVVFDNSFDQSHVHANGFDFDARCPRGINDGPAEKECCGQLQHEFEI